MSLPHVVYSHRWDKEQGKDEYSSLILQMENLGTESLNDLHKDTLNSILLQEQHLGNQWNSLWSEVLLNVSEGIRNLAHN